MMMGIASMHADSGQWPGRHLPVGVVVVPPVRYRRPRRGGAGCRGGCQACRDPCAGVRDAAGVNVTSQHAPDVEHHRPARHPRLSSPSASFSGCDLVQVDQEGGRACRSCGLQDGAVHSLLAPQAPQRGSLQDGRHPKGSRDPSCGLQDATRGRARSLLRSAGRQAPQGGPAIPLAVCGVLCGL